MMSYLKGFIGGSVVVDSRAKRRRFITWQTTLWSLIALLAGAVLGSALGPSAARTSPLLATLSGIGTLWVNALRMVALPLAIGNTMRGMVSERGANSAGRIGGAVAVYVVLLLMGAAMVLTVVPPILRSTPVDHAAIASLSQGASAQARKLAGETHGDGTLGDVLTGLVPRNLLQSATNEEFLKLLVFAILFGLALRRVNPEKSAPVIGFLEGVTDAFMVLVRWIIFCSPVALFALAATFASSGARLVGILGRFVLLECVLMLAFVALLYPLARLAGGVPLRRFASAAAEPQLVAITSRSSLAALPSLMAANEKMLPDYPETGRIVLPLAVSMFKVNRTISALCRVLVILHFWSIPAGQSHVYAFLLTVILLSFSELGLPGGTQFRTVPAYLAAGCPIEAVVLLEVIEPFSDICKTVLNVTGDLTVAAIVTRWSERRAPVPAPAQTMVPAESAAS